MNHTLKLHLLLTTCLVVSCLSSCHLESLDDDMRNEMYTRNFIKEFGLIDPEQDWNMSKEATVKINVGDDRAKSIKVYAKYGKDYYLVADLEDLKGSFDVPVDVPKDCQEVMVKVNGAIYYGQMGALIDCSDHPANRATVPSRASVVDDPYAYHYDSTDPWYEAEINGVKIKVSQPDPAYIYFNAQQMAPILQPDVWSNYWSMSWTGGKWQTNDNNDSGYLPEIGIANQTYQEGNAYLHSDKVTQDFVYQMQNPDVGFDIYPMFYGSNLRHTLGVYLLDDDRKPMVYPNDYADVSLRGKPIKYPIYQSKHGDDIQVKTDKYETEDLSGTAEGQYRVKVDGEVVSKSSEGTTNGGFPLNLTVGTPVTIKFVYMNGASEAAFPNNTVVRMADDQGFKIIASNHTTMTNGIQVTGIDTFTLEATETGSGKWVKFEVGESGSLVEYPFVCSAVAAPVTTNVKRIEFWEGSNIVPAAGILLAEDESKDLVVKCFDAVSGGNTISDSHLRIANWHPTVFKVNDQANSGTLQLTSYDSNLGGYRVKITGVSETAVSGEGASAGIQWTFAFVDLDDSWNVSGDEPNASLQVTVKNPQTHSHTETITVNGDNWPLSSPTWDSHFWTQDEINARSGAPRRSVRSRAAEITLWSGTAEISGYSARTKLSFANATTINADDEIKVYYSVGTAQNGTILTLYDYNGNTEIISKGGNIGESYVEVAAVSESLATALNSVHAVDAWGNNVTVTKITLVPVVAPDPVVDDWHDGAQSTMKTALESYYATQTQTYSCDDNDGISLSSNDSGVTRTITVTVSGANKTNASATVTIKLTKRETPTPKPSKAPNFRNKGKKVAATGKKSASSKKAASKKAAVTSRAGDPTWEELNDPTTGALYYDDNTEWHSIRKVYVPKKNTTDSYEYKEPLLVKSRGYRVKLINPVTNQPWEGYFGMYIDYDWGLAADVNCGNQDHVVNTGRDNSVKDGWTPGGDGRPEKGTHYSQSHLNELVYDGRTYPISYAATFTHPKSTNKYLCFEDWDVTLPSGDVSTTNYSATYSYNNWSWVSNTGHYSSDRDLNDIIYRQVGLKEIPTSQINTQNMGFDWIWALEDLGSTDDFDFNDVVIRINSITKTVKKDNQEPTIVKNVSFTPLAAGGTLPVYIHYRYDATHDYVLKPSPVSAGQYVPYDLSTEEGRANGGMASGGLSQTDGAEFHTWFGINSSSTMINTGAGPSVNPSTKCEILIPKNHSLNTNGKYMPQGDNNSLYTSDAKGFRFYVTIGGPVAATTQENIDTGRLDSENGAYMVTLPEKGAAAQSFLIVEYYYSFSSSTGDPDVNNSKVYAQPWYWPKERAHILDAYPRFKDWINNAANTNWWADGNRNNKYLYGAPDN